MVPAMARRTRPAFACENCGAESPRWEGRCPHCGDWNTLVEVVRAPAARRRGAWTGPNATGDAATPVLLRNVRIDEHPRLMFASAEVNRVLGGGLVPGSVVLVAGDPGIGKSTLLLAAAASASPNSAGGSPVLYVTGEESTAQVKLRADRLEVDSDGLYLFPATGLSDILAQLEELSPSLVVIDSIQTVFDEELPSEAGSLAQIRECARRLTQWAKSSGVSVIMTGHVTKGGDIAGPRILEHVVDVVLYLEGDPVSSFRLLRSVKNRFGSTNEVGVFEMTETGMRDVADPSAHLLSQHTVGSVGSIIVPAVEGTRPLLVEVQALTNPSLLPTPRRVASGVDYNRLLLVCAVLTRRVGISLSGQDVIVNVTGGVRVAETAADLAIALAVVSSVRDVPVNAATAAFGELGLSGEVRRVSQPDRRVEEASRLGLRACVMPSDTDAEPRGSLKSKRVSTLREAIRASMPRARRSKTPEV